VPPRSEASFDRAAIGKMMAIGSKPQRPKSGLGVTSCERENGDDLERSAFRRE
jgi:hypothetical protein